MGSLPEYAHILDAGILALLKYEGNSTEVCLTPELMSEIKEDTGRRGPDGCCTLKFEKSEYFVTALSLRRKKDGPDMPNERPIILYSGEQYSKIFEHLVDLPDVGFAESLLDFLNSLEGQFAFIVSRGSQVFFGRDPMGRRSLGNPYSHS